MKIYYKVINIINGVFRSAVTSDQLETRNTMFDLEYKENKWTYPKIGKMFIFENLFDAKRFSESEGSRAKVRGEELVIYEIECKNPVELKNRAEFHYDTGSNFKNFWHKKRAIRTSTPRGTFCCSAIKLIKKV